MRLRKKPWIAEAIKQFPTLVDPGTAAGRWLAVFGRPAPLHVELGTGKGKFIAELAAGQPEIDFIGVEAAQDVLYYAAAKAQDRQLTNVRFLLLDAENLRAAFAPGEVDRLYINFCDPWPKKRHAKRRLTHRRFLDLYRVILRPEGELFFKTDNEQLFEYSLNEFADAGLRLRNITFDLHRGGAAVEAMTEYEVKFNALGLRIYRCEAVFPAIM